LQLLVELEEVLGAVRGVVEVIGLGWPAVVRW